MERVGKTKKSIRPALPAMTKRWFLGSLMWIILLLVLADIAVFFFARASYYSSAMQAVSYRLDSVMSRVPAVTVGSKERRATLLSFVEEYPEKDRFELILLDSHGDTIITSSGFMPFSSRTSDYMAAISSADGRGSYTGRSDQGEKVVAITELLSQPAGEICAIRIVASLEKVDAQILLISGITTAAEILIIIFCALSSGYFIRSIVRPVQEIGKTAKDIASGNFDVRIQTEYNDEIGELCDQINEMARGLSETERMKNEFISSVSHELRTPLTSIKGWGETIRTVGAKDPETFQKGISIILSETNRLSNMVEDLLDFSRMQKNTRLAFREEPLDLVAELTEAVIIVDQRARRAGISFNYNEPPEIVPICGDKGRIRQVFANLFDNAIKYSKSGSSVDVSLTEDGISAQVVIRDHGLGIPPADIPKLTTRFYKASNATTGSGIGLSVVFEIMNLHGGSMDIQSELGEGTVITLTFPLICETSDDPTEQEQIKE